MEFIYRAKKGLDATLEGKIEAENEQEALNKLIKMGIFPITIAEAKNAQEKIAPHNVVKKSFRLNLKVIPSNKIKSADILIFTQKLTTLIRAKVELLSALKILYEQTQNTRLQEVILEIYNRIKEGKNFSESLACFQNIFSPLYINLIKSGEASGRLDSSLEQINEFLSREENLKTKIAVALAYPGLLLLVGLTSIFVLINFVIPRLKPIFDSLGRELPLITRIILKVSTFSNKNWWLVLGVVAALMMILYVQKGNTFFSLVLRKLKTNLPIVKNLTKNQEMVNFSRSLGLLLKSGVPALRSLEIATQSIEEPKLKEELKMMCREVATGQSLYKSMLNHTGLPDFFVKMVAIGEESGRLSEVLEETSRSYVQQIEKDIALVTSLLEPVLILGMGLVLGTIVLSILLPTFQITQLVH